LFWSAATAVAALNAASRSSRQLRLPQSKAATAVAALQKAAFLLSTAAMKKALFALLLVLLALPLEAQIRWGVRGGVYVDGETSAAIGAEMVLPFGSHFVFNPNAEISENAMTANADLHYDFNVGSGTAFWVGAGFAEIIPKLGDLDVGVNLFAGAGARSNRWYPYVQVKRTIPSDYESFSSIVVGVRF